IVRGTCIVSYKPSSTGSPVTITATYGGDVNYLRSSGSFSLNVTSSTSTFDYSLSNSGPVSIVQGSLGTLTITAALTAGNAAAVTLSCLAPLPTGVSCSFATNPVTPTGSTALRIFTSASTPLGSMTVMVTGAPLGTTTTPTSVGVTVTGGTFDYSLS